MGDEDAFQRDARARRAELEAIQSAALAFIDDLSGASWTTARVHDQDNVVDVDVVSDDATALRRAVYAKFGTTVRPRVVAAKRAERRAAPSRRVGVDLASALGADRGEAAWNAAVGSLRSLVPTPEELEEQEHRADAARRASRDYLATHASVFGGAVIHSDAYGVHFSVSFTDDLEAHRAALGNDVVVYRARYTLAELESTRDRLLVLLVGRRDITRPQVTLSVFRNRVELRAQMVDDRPIREELAERFGDAVFLEWDGLRVTEGLSLDES